MKFVDFLMWFFWGAGVVFVALFLVGVVIGVVKAIKDDVRRKEHASRILFVKKWKLRTEYATLKAIEKCVSIVGAERTVGLLEEIHDFLIDKYEVDQDEEVALERQNKLESDYKCLCPTDCIAGIDKRYACPLWNDCSECEFLSEIETVEK